MKKVLGILGVVIFALGLVVTDGKPPIGGAPVKPVDVAGKPPIGGAPIVAQVPTSGNMIILGKPPIGG